MKQRRNSKNVRDYFYDKIEAAVEAFDERVKDFARRGDERSDLKGFDFEGLQTLVNANKDMTAQHRNQVLSKLRKANKGANKIGDLIDYHQRDMEQGLSGSEYHRHLADLESALGM
jgi:hypothetical protein